MISNHREKISDTFYDGFRLLLRQSIPIWNGKLQLVINLCCIAIHIEYEANFTSKFVKPPMPRPIKDLKELFNVFGYKFAKSI